jgi:hypothetical protein
MEGIFRVQIVFLYTFKKDLFELWDSKERYKGVLPI